MMTKWVALCYVVLKLNVAIAIHTSHRKRFIERSSKICGLNLSQGLEQLVYENVDSLQYRTKLQSIQASRHNLESSCIKDQNGVAQEVQMME